MHREFRKRLDSARGESRAVVVVFFDIRGFTAFSTTVEAVESAAYVKRIYQKVLDDYFPKASFFKPTGDGLMIVYDYDAATVQETTSLVVASSLRLGVEFANLAAGDPMVNFEVPARAGFGIARGSACCMLSGSKILDYSGRLINLAARLLDLARPEGTVLDGAIGIDLLDPEQRELFVADTVVIRGIAERAPGMPVWVTKALTVVPESAHKSLDEVVWIDHVESFSSLKQMASMQQYRIRLKKPPNARSISAEVYHPPPRRRLKGPGTQVRSALPSGEFEYYRVANEHFVRLYCEKIALRLKKGRVLQSSPIRVRIMYQPA